jgi:hypothetical protein
LKHTASPKPMLPRQRGDTRIEAFGASCL